MRSSHIEDCATAPIDSLALTANCATSDVTSGGEPIPRPFCLGTINESEDGQSQDTNNDDLAFSDLRYYTSSLVCLLCVLCVFSSFYFCAICGRTR